jgi:prepilin-type processing-associated H-X9-DG protein
MYDNSGDWGIYSDPDLPAGHGDNGPTSYGYNAASSGLTSGWNSSVEPQQEYNGKHEAQLRRPSSLVAFCDASQMDTPETAAADPNWNAGNDPTHCTNYETNNGANEQGPCGPFNFNPKVWQAQNPWASVDWDFGVPGLAGDADFAANGSRRPHARHHGKINAVFADGHGKAIDGDTYKARLGSPEDIWHDHE